MNSQIFRIRFENDLIEWVLCKIPDFSDIDLHYRLSLISYRKNAVCYFINGFCLSIYDRRLQIARIWMENAHILIYCYPCCNKRGNICADLYIDLDLIHQAMIQIGIDSHSSVSQILIALSLNYYRACIIIWSKEIHSH